jgi:hypothetical protein
MNREITGTHQKALQINLDPTKYGTFAEIGAGQEVARWFFRVGGAAGTIAKTMSAYDMTISDAIYGQADRYVTRQRLHSMLDHEYGLLEERLKDKRGANTKFFVFADTVKARGYKQQVADESHGWLGVRFQTEPLGPPSEVIIHVRMLDPENVPQQEALGVMGVNLIYAALYLHHDPRTFIHSLMDNLTSERVETDMIKFSGPAFKQIDNRLYLHHDPRTFIHSLMDNLTSERVETDMIKFSGPAFKQIDNRLMTLELVQQGLANAAMFTAGGEMVHAAEVLYKKPILVERGSFRPVTKVTLDMLECAQAQFVQEPAVQGEPIVVLMEMTLKNLTEGGVIDHRDFLDRVDLLGSLGKTVLISNYGEYYRLAAYLFRYTKKMIGVVMGVPTLRELFEEKYYADLEGGILESFGRLFKNALKLYVYPLRDPVNGALITAENLRVAPNLRHLYAYLLENLYIHGLRGYGENCLPIFSRDVLSKIRANDASWEQMVPKEVAALIKERKLFGYRE